VRIAAATVLAMRLAIASGVRLVSVSVSDSGAGCLSFLRLFFFEGELSSSLSGLRFWGVTGGGLVAVAKASFALREGVRCRPEVRGDFSDPMGDVGWEFGMRSRSLVLSGGGAGGLPRDADAVDGFGWTSFFLLVAGGVRSTGIQGIGN
jgi:hypothetical protein